MSSGSAAWLGAPVGRWRSSLFRGSFLLLLSVVTVALGQGAPLVEMQLGHRNVPVAEAWNPLRLLLRDLGPSELVIVVDQGSLREGELPWTVVLPLEGGAGLRQVEQDVYLPAWRSLRWIVQAGGLTVASGALARADADPSAVDLVVSERPGVVADRLAGRVLDLAPEALPVRTASYDGVRSLWLDGTRPSPPPAVLTAAAVAGTVVVLGVAAQDDPAVAAVLAGLEAGWHPIGAGGWWLLAAGEALPSEAAVEGRRLDVHAIGRAFAAASAIPTPRSAPLSRLLPLLIGYAFLVVLAWRLAGAAGILCWAVVLALGATFSTRLSPPNPPTLVEARELRLSVGGLAWSLRVHDLFTLPQASLDLPMVGQPLLPQGGGVRLAGPPSTRLDLAAWRGASLMEAPRAASPWLSLDVLDPDVLLGADGLSALREVGPGGGSPLAGSPSANGLTPAEAAFESLLPSGSRWGRSGNDWYVALPLADGGAP